MNKIWPQKPANVLVAEVLIVFDCQKQMDNDTLDQFMQNKLDMLCQNTIITF